MDGDESRATQTTLWNTLCLLLHRMVADGFVQHATAIILGENLVDLPAPMYYQVWLFCIFGAIYIWIGQYEKAHRQYQRAKALWEGPRGRRTIPPGNEKAKQAHSNMIAKGMELALLGIGKCLDGRGRRIPQKAWDRIVETFAESTSMSEGAGGDSDVDSDAGDDLGVEENERGADGNTERRVKADDLISLIRELHGLATESKVGTEDFDEARVGTQVESEETKGSEKDEGAQDDLGKSGKEKKGKTGKKGKKDKKAKKGSRQKGRH